MFYSQNRDSLRQKFFETYQKAQSGMAMDNIEQMIWHVIKAHPEYHDVLEKPESYLNRDFSIEMGQTNPFLHLSAHIGLHEQLSTDRPKGIQKIYQLLIEKAQKDSHEIEHLMIDQLMETMWQAQRDNVQPDDRAYLKKLKKLLKK